VILPEAPRHAPEQRARQIAEVLAAHEGPDPRGLLRTDRSRPVALGDDEPIEQVRAEILHDGRDGDVVRPDEAQHLVDEAEVVLQEDLVGELGVGVHAPGLEARPPRAQDVGAIEDARRGSHHELAIDEHEPARLAPAETPQGAGHARAAEVLAEEVVGAHHAGVGLPLRDVDEPRDALGEEDVVGEGELDVLRIGARELQRQIEVGELVDERRIHDEPDPRVHRGVALGDLAGAVVAPVVHDDVLEIAVRLGEHALDALLEVPRRVVERGDDADEGRVGHVPGRFGPLRDPRAPSFLRDGPSGGVP
jgi:hypothetical protein